MRFNIKLYLKDIKKPLVFNNVAIGLDPSVFRVFIEPFYKRIHKKSVNFPLSNILYWEAEVLALDEKDKAIEDIMSKNDVAITKDVKDGKLTKIDLDAFT
jgi:hypothetical protein